jgi:membrane protease YdiL (CAAX protease family)
MSVALKVGMFAVLEILGLMVFGWALPPVAGYLAGSALSVFIAAALANALAMRIYEQGRLGDIGFAWNAAAVRNLCLGLGGGVVAAGVVLGGPLVAGAAAFSRVPQSDSHWSSVLFVLVILLFGGIGEEMFFHGYGFQVLLRALGPWATILPVSLLFGLAHSRNLNFSWNLGFLNTAGWGVLLGYAFWRSRDLWLPTGLHVGWNWALPLFGANLSGFTIKVTGYEMSWKLGPLWSGGEYGPEASVLTCGILALLFVYLRKAPVRRQSAFLLRAREEA